MKGRYVKLDSAKMRWNRDRLGWTLDTLAEQAEVAEGTALRAEHGEDIRPSSGRRIARAFGVDISELVPDRPGSVPPKKATAPPSPPPRTGKERRVVWESAVEDARRLRETGRDRLEELLASWRASKERGEPSGARRAYRKEMGELLQQAYDAETALFSTLGRPQPGRPFDLDEFAELQAASRFYGELRGLVEGAELSIRTDGAPRGERAQQAQPKSHTVEESKAA